MKKGIIRSILFYVLFGGVCFLAGICFVGIRHVGYYEETDGLVHVFSDQTIKKFKQNLKQYIESYSKQLTDKGQRLVPSEDGGLLPLVRVGDIYIEYDRKTGNYRISTGKEKTVLCFPIAEQREIKDTAQDMTDPHAVQSCIVHSKVLKGETYPHASCRFFYDQHGKPYRTVYATVNPDGSFNHHYYDINGDGKFDEMDVFENGKRTRYKLIGREWVKQLEEDYPREKMSIPEGKDMPVAE